MFTDVDFRSSDAMQINEEHTAQIEPPLQEWDGDDVLLADVNDRHRSPVPELNVSVSDVLPLPTAPQQNPSRRSKAAQKAQVLTTTPYKEELEAKKNVIDGIKKQQVKRKIDCEKATFKI